LIKVDDPPSASSKLRIEGQRFFEVVKKCSPSFSERERERERGEEQSQRHNNKQKQQTTLRVFSVFCVFLSLREGGT